MESQSKYTGQRAEAEGRAGRGFESVESLEQVCYVRNLLSAEKFIQMKRRLEGEGNVELSFLTEFQINH